ncbi:MAG: septum formation initiator family protein [Deltaproteobacteria bacterium]|jgi:cell division protein FtsB|nr:septum formation initiator family protein [Deltaproteobacteria bacterium]
MTIPKEIIEHQEDEKNLKLKMIYRFLSYFTTLSAKILWSCFLLIIGLSVIYLFFSDDGYPRNSGLLRKKAELEAETLRLDEENRQLEARLERIRNDSGYLEDEARKKLGLVRPDEIIYRLEEEPELSDKEVGEQLN